MKKIIIAIDGNSSGGKSTLAKAIAAELAYLYVDSGAMYRAITLYLINHKIALDDLDAIRAALEEITISFHYKNGQNRTLLNGRDVEDEIREMRVSNQVSQVAAISIIRRKVVQQQQQLGKHRGIVMDGRDIGTVVFPDAELKIFMTASIEVRTERRYLELKEKGQQITRAAVRKNLEERDYKDSTRADSPLKKAEGAIALDTSEMSQEEQLATAMQLVESILEKV